MSPRTPPDVIGFFGGTKAECGRLIAGRLAGGKQTTIVTPNPIMIERAVRDRKFRAVLNDATIRLADGVGIVLAARLAGTSLTRIPGIEMAETLLACAARYGYRVYLLGGKPGVAKEAAARLRTRLPGLCICGVRDGYFSAAEAERVTADIAAAHPDFLFVCLGSPKQENWIAENQSRLPGVRLFMALGGSLDVWSGRLERAPALLRAAGLEWLWRMAHEPRRLRELPLIVAFSGRTLAFCSARIVKLHRTGKKIFPS